MNDNYPRVPRNWRGVDRCALICAAIGAVIIGLAYGTLSAALVGATVTGLLGLLGAITRRALQIATAPPAWQAYEIARRAREDRGKRRHRPF